MNKNVCLCALLGLLGVAAVLSGCKVYGPERAEGSGFLGGPEEYAKMHQVEGFLRKAAYAWVKQDVKWAQYRSVYLKPVKFQFADPEQGKKVEQADIDRLKQSFNKAMQQQLGKKYPLVNAVGPGVLIIDPCLTSVAPTEAGRNAALALVGLPSVFSGGVSIEIAFFDGPSKELIATFMDTKAGESSGIGHMLTDKYTKWGNIDSAFLKWAKELCQALDKAHSMNLSSQPPAQP